LVHRKMPLTLCRYPVRISAWVVIFCDASSVLLARHGLGASFWDTFFESTPMIGTTSELYPRRECHVLRVPSDQFFQVPCILPIVWIASLLTDSSTHFEIPYTTSVEVWLHKIGSWTIWVFSPFAQVKQKQTSDDERLTSKLVGCVLCP
jgi:hypothetical protein